MESNLILSLSDIIDIAGIIAAFATSIIAIIISVKTLQQNSKAIEESSRAVISVYSQEINTGSPMFYIVVKNFGHSMAVIQKFDYDYDFSDCYYKSASKDYLQELIGSSIAPGQSRICRIDYSKIQRPVTFSLTYTSIGKVYSDTFTVDLKAGVAMPTSKTATENRELHAISYTLQEILQKNL